VTDLLAFQKQWAASTAAPLRFVGKGRAEVPALDYDASLVEGIVQGRGVGGVERLGAYRMQYWFRLLTLLQKDNPLLGHLLGWEAFNPLAAQYLRAHPPGRDPSRLSDDFPAWLEERGSRPTWIEAARVDHAWEEVFRAEEGPRPDTAWLAEVEQGRAEIVLQPSFRLVRLGRDWISLRFALLEGTEVAPGPPAVRPRYWALSRSGSMLRADPLEPGMADLLGELVGGRSWLDSLETVGERRPRLTRQVAGWFAAGQRWGIWAIRPTT
jgi:Putative DNA-binding domain